MIDGSREDLLGIPHSSFFIPTIAPFPLLASGRLRLNVRSGDVTVGSMT